MQQRGDQQAKKRLNKPLSNMQRSNNQLSIIANEDHTRLLLLNHSKLKATKTTGNVSHLFFFLLVIRYQPKVNTHKMAILMVILTDQFNRCQNFAWFYIVSQFIQFHSKINRSIIQYFYPSNILLNIRMRKMKTPSKERMVHQCIILEEEVHTLIYLCQTLNILVPAAAAVRQSGPM